MLFLNVSFGDIVSIDNGRIVMHIKERKGSSTKIGIDADKSISIDLRKPAATVARVGLTKR